MKLYKFYYKANKNNIAYDIKEQQMKSETDYLQNKYPLYAFTTDKKIYKEFKNERNMDNFIIIKTGIDREDYVGYADDHRDMLLDIVELPIKDKDGSVHHVDFALTQYEQLVIDDTDIEYLFGGPEYFIPYLIFNKDIIKALRVLEYPFFYNTIVGENLEDDECDNDNVTVTNNDFEILYSQFSGTFD